MLDYYVDAKMTELFWEDLDALIQLRDFSKSTMHKPDARARNKLIKKGLLQIDGEFAPEILEAVCHVLSKKRIVIS